MLSMDRDGSIATFSLKKRRTSLSRRRPSSWGHLLSVHGETYESSSQLFAPTLKDGQQNGTPIWKVDMPKNCFRKELLQSKHVSNGPDSSRSLDDISETDCTDSKPALKVFRKRKENSPYGKHTERRSHIYECSENFHAVKKQKKGNCSSVEKHPQLLQSEERRYSHGDGFRSKLGGSSNNSNHGIVFGHSFDGYMHIGHKEDLHHDTRSISTKHGPEQRHKGKPALPLHATSPKHFGSRTIKRPPSKDGTPQQAKGGMCFRKHASRDSSSMLEAKRHGCFQVLQNTLEDDEGPPLLRDDSSEADVDGESNLQSRPEVVKKNSRNNGHGHLQTLDHSGLPVLSVRKSSRVPKRRILDGDDVEVLRRPRKKIEHEFTPDYDGDRAPSQGTDTTRDDKLLSETHCLKEPSMTASDLLEPDFDEKELLLTARQRAIKASKEGREPELSSDLEMSDGLLPGLPRRQKETVTEAEQAIKKEEAARRRKQQMERNAKEIQALAIQKILGQESSRKKREEKLQKQRQEIEQEKRAASMVPAINSIRWVMGPSGNIVSFSQDVELSQIFSGPCSYPQEREKCAGPLCNNPYKYRDSKTLLPLCSLDCYKAVQRFPPNTAPAF